MQGLGQTAIISKSSARSNELDSNLARTDRHCDTDRQWIKSCRPIMVYNRRDLTTRSLRRYHYDVSICQQAARPLAGWRGFPRIEELTEKPI
ncbi:hypothetical protein RRG08_002819 [Elysia crispata]|uniref:Uncharacterized protein n=1 Tax=Elysia crispata TaxID=231223 RepID=A0AAE0XU48_9GAST|nr:hypothetical protein RRG08_002819 [Elysia crispata]